jgi:uncharacterized membrane protein
MEARFRTWWQIKQHLLTTLVVVIILVVAIALIIIIGYRFDWTGFNGNNKSGKTLWDWLQLLIIPVVLAVAGYAINLTISRSEQEATKQRDKTEHEIALDNQREAALQEYIDKMSELLLHEKLRESQSGAEVRNIALARTLAVMHTLDARRTALNGAELRVEALIYYKKRGMRTVFGLSIRTIKALLGLHQCLLVVSISSLPVQN